jgi:dienelactone hydrolase
MNPRLLPRALALALALALGCAPKESAEPPAPPAQQSRRVEEVATREVTYEAGGTPLHGFVAFPATRSSLRPAILIVHEWWGHNEHARAQARRLAESGYIGFAVDMYGDGKSTTHPESAQAMVSRATRDPAVMLARFNAALAVLKADVHVDTSRIAAIGYCFGGLVVLDQARRGADLDLVASFHGAMPPPAPVDSGAMRARVLILTGDADPMVPAAQVDSFAAALRRAGGQVEVITLAGARHSFTNPRADSVGMPALKYDAHADSTSWQALLRSLSDAFRR